MYRLSDWISCMAVVNFDLNLGQAVEFIYPPKCTPSKQELSNICYMAFPDSNSGCMGDTKFHMLVRLAPDCKIRKLSRNLCNYNSLCLPLLKADQTHYWGFVYFRQNKDATLPRGYFQKSFIVITRMPFFNLFYDLVEEIAPKYFNDGNMALVDACQQIEQKWPSLKAGVSLKLNMFDVNYHVLIPRANSRKVNFSQDFSTLDENSLILRTKKLSSINEIELFNSLALIIDHIYTLWELVLTAEPIVVVGSSPADCSHMVQTLVALITPLGYFGEARPYFTIHDSEFKEFTREDGNAALPSTILGVTNPFFVKLLKDWPHILKLTENQTNNPQSQLCKHSISNSGVSASNCNNCVNNKRISNSQAFSSQYVTTFNNFRGGDGTTQLLMTKYKPFLKKDKSFIKKVFLGMKTERPAHVQTAFLRRNLLELTQSFMIPLERYVASLMPFQKHISPLKSAPNANRFKLKDFLATLELSGPHLTSSLKGDWHGLYRRFYHSPNFRGWYERRHRELQLTLQDLHLRALSEVNLSHWAQDKQEVEIIDMILKLKQKLNTYTEKSHRYSRSAEGEKTRVIKHKELVAKIQCIKNMLPTNLKNSLNI